ncbi:3-deoxy-manno-octulosonate cytidylyltransferase [Colwellia sp. BRX8-4]|uniref:3-deoxy-manno-octulosonate cytidylyltransferase n=1 Tax=unclassified Colwellia TaxID=196834 RepID=UPI0015F40A5A|nr:MULTISPECIES: 3-deoxy-manno-octulosonate cytidylyltransferase [unclassified Colwellia]MBA6352127.1 3-deoxy-manno-octulosonate cytidylyltransferase [Colwellia sp. BRX9-1]MBA6365663.1 3-deoxy-manno-octulosonate cytidylyltransferase [Colwellia sp. BRX8-8]MBA6372632.1 3-deoxy-manno-octulosonate cytidylyltransferase [Colwellia sp. BRX8-4]
MSFIVVIPARFESSRLPGKVLADINGKPMIQWVVEKAQQSGASQVIVATDNKQVEEAVLAFGGEVCKTRADHQSGTERLAEVMNIYNFDDDQVIVNVQGDEPFIPAENIAQVARNLADQQRTNQQQARMATLAVHIHDVEEAFNPNAVKVLTDKHGYAMYFSRSTIPYDRDRFLNEESIAAIGDFYLRHIGIYAYRAGFIKDYVQWPASQLEQIESLEQLRVLWQGEKIHVAVAETRLVVEGVDTPEDLEKARAYALTL